MRVPLNSTNKKIVEDYVRILSPIFKLTPREIKVITNIATLYYGNRTKVVNTNQDIYRLIMSQPARKAIRKVINISEASYNNTITSLRKKNAIRGERLHPIFTMLDVKNNIAEITFQIKINDRQE